MAAVEHEGLASRILMDETMLIAAGTGHPLARRSDLSWEDVAACNWYVPRPGTAAHGALAALLASHGLRMPDAAVESINMSLNLALLAQGEFIGLLPRLLALEMAAQGRLAILPLETRGLLSETRVFWRTGEHDATRSLLLDCLAEASQAPSRLGDA